MKLNYFTTTNVWLSLEDFYNAGLEPEKAKAIIENMADPGSSSLNLRCHESGFNRNWIVETNCSRDYIPYLVGSIRNRLYEDLQKTPQVQQCAKLNS